MWLLIKILGSYSSISQILTNSLRSTSKAISSLNAFLIFKLNVDAPCSKFSMIQLCFCFTSSNNTMFLQMFMFFVCLFVFCNCILALLLDYKLHQGGYFFSFTHFCPMHVHKIVPFCIREEVNYSVFMVSKI